MDHAHGDRGVVSAHDFGDLRSDGGHGCGTAVCAMREPMAAERIVDAARNDVWSAAAQRTQICAVYAAALVEVQQRDTTGCQRHRQRATADFPNLYVETADALRERAVAPCDQHLPHAAALKTLDQQLRLAFAAAIAACGVDVRD